MLTRNMPGRKCFTRSFNSGEKKKKERKKTKKKKKKKKKKRKGESCVCARAFVFREGRILFSC